MSSYFVIFQRLVSIRLLLFSLFIVGCSIGNSSTIRKADSSHSAADSVPTLFTDEAPEFQLASLSDPNASHASSNVKRFRNARLRAPTSSINTSFLPRSGNRIKLNLFDDTAFEAVIQQGVPNKFLGVNANGDFETWQAIGQISGADGSLVVFSGIGPHIAGHVHIPGKGRFRLIGTATEKIRIEELTLQTPGCGTCEAPNRGLLARTAFDRAIAKAQVAPVLQPTTQFVTIVDVMVVYTAQAVQGAGGEQSIRTLINLANAEANAVLQNSRANVRFRIAHTQQIAYQEHEKFTTNLTRLRLPDDGFMDDVHALRETNKADLVCLITESGDSGRGGLASVMTFPGPQSKSFGFSVVRRADAIGNYVFVHELGHNFGCQHDRDNAADDLGVIQQGVFHYSFGHRFTAEDKVYRTVMAYPPGEVVPFFSTPAIRFLNQPLGVDLLQTNIAADNVLTLNTTAPIVGAYSGNLTQTLVPNINWEAPNDNAEFQAGDSVTVSVSANDPDGRIRQVEFYDGRNLLGVVEDPTQTTVNFVLKNVPSGLHVLTVRAIDNLGAANTLLARTIAVRPNNDLFANRAEISGETVTIEGNHHAATREAGEPILGTNLGDGSVWYTWTAPKPGAVRIVGTGRQSVPLVGVYQGEVVNSLSTAFKSVAFDPGNLSCTVDLDVLAGQTIRISVDSPVGHDDQFVLKLKYVVAPDNDAFATAQGIEGDPIKIEATNDSATAENGESQHMGNAGGKSVWYRWKAPRTGNVIASVTGKGAVFLVDAYTGNTVNALTPAPGRVLAIDSANFTSQTTFTATAEVVYSIAVDGAGGRTGDFVLTLNYPAPPANDLFANREALTGNNITFKVNNLYASAEAGEPLPAGNPGGKSVWYAWTAPVSGPVTVLVKATGFTPLPDAFRGTAVNALTPVNRGIKTITTTQTELTFTAVLGETYPLVIDGFRGRGGEIEFSLLTKNTAAGLVPNSFELVNGSSFRLQVNGTVGQNYEVQQSADLIRWERAEAGTVKEGSTFFSTPITSSNIRFFRIRPLP